MASQPNRYPTGDRDDTGPARRGATRTAVYAVGGLITLVLVVVLLHLTGVVGS